MTLNITCILVVYPSVSWQARHPKSPKNPFPRFVPVDTMRLALMPLLHGSTLSIKADPASPAAKPQPLQAKRTGRLP
jgi:hypothetical protein